MISAGWSKTLMQGGVDTSKIIWREFDGLGRNTRVGLNFTEKGFASAPRSAARIVATGRLADQTRK
jgi:hypothetical protein